MKKVFKLFPPPPRHWVGDGFPVCSLIDYNQHGKLLSPFLLLDFTGTWSFPPAETPRGVGEHPHRGFETVTIVHKGEVAHRDTTGQGGMIGPGDVQWMTAGSGIQHQEFHSEAFTRQGGEMEMAQLWVNLPARDKLTAPAYQAILDAQIPTLALASGGSLRVIAGEYECQRGPAHTFTPMQVWDLTLPAGSQVDLPARAGWNTAVVVLHGDLVIAGDTAAFENHLAVLDPAETGCSLKAVSDAAVLFLSGEPLGEPIAGYGPFVMNTREEILQAIEDYNRGNFGKITP